MLNSAHNHGVMLQSKIPLATVGLTKKSQNLKPLLTGSSSKISKNLKKKSKKPLLTGLPFKDIQKVERHKET